MPANIKWTALALMGGVYVAGAQEPKVSGMEPSAFAPGKMTRVVLHGENVETNWSLWTSFPAEVKGDQVTLAPNTPVGIGAIRAVNGKGASAFHLVMIDDLPTVKESSSNQTVAAAQEIKPPVAIDGECNEVAFDYFALEARKGQEFTLETVAQRLGSQADTVIRITDEKGREHAFNDDGPSVGRDSGLIFKAPAGGRFLLEVRDINYQGGPQYRYRLRVGSFPLIAAPYPPVVAGERETKVELIAGKTIKVRAAENAARFPVSVRGKAGSGFASLMVSDWDESLEKEPNDAIEQAGPVERSVCGRFEKENDRDLFRFEAKKDDRLVLAARTRSLGSPCDVLLNVLKADGSKLVEANVTGADEGTITNTFKDAGTYYAELQELTLSGSPDFVYRLTVSPLEAGFELSTDQDRFEARDGKFTLKVSATRRQYDGPIELSVVNGEEVEIENNVIPEKKNETVLKLKPKEGFVRGKLAHLRLAGEAKIGERAVTVPMSTRPALRKLWPKAPMLPIELDGLVAIVVP